MADFWKGQMLGLDIESTGKDNHTDRIVTYSMVYSAYAGAVPEIREWLVDPQIEIPEGASEVHGITTEHAQQYGMHPSQALIEIRDSLLPIAAAGIPIVIFNAPYDTTMTLAEFERWNIPLPCTAEQLFSRVIDPYVIDKAVDTYRPGSRKLVDVAAHYGYTEFSAHESTADVLATIHVARALEKFANPETTIDDLQIFQKKAKAKQAASFQAYLRKKKDDDGNLVNPIAVVNGDWPFETR